MAEVTAKGLGKIVPSVENTVRELSGKLVIVYPNHSSQIAQRYLGTFIGVSTGGVAVLRNAKIVESNATIEDIINSKDVDLFPVLLALNAEMIVPVLDSDNDYAYVTTELRR